ncbi:MAG: Uma2 family endonuclease [Cyanobacteria bacterium P01_H01_bin.26]
MASYSTVSERLDAWLDFKPESKLELIDGQLIVGNSLMGSRLLLRQLLQGWSVGAAISLAPIEAWLDALAVAYQVSLPDTKPLALQIDRLEIQFADAAFIPEDLHMGSAERTWSHHRVRQQLTLDLFRLDKTVGGWSLGRDFVMRLGDNGVTPDLLFFKGQGLNQLYEAYLSGPAELVIEVLMPGHEQSDIKLKYAGYQATGVPEYWLIHPESQQVEFYCLIDGQYCRQYLDDDGYYRPDNVPGLAFFPAALWHDDEECISCFVVEQAIDSDQQLQAESGASWGSLLFTPNVQLEAVPIAFEEYMSWCPEAKFEFIQGKPLIGSTLGTRNVLAMLLMTFGLKSTVKLLPSSAWIQGLRQQLEQNRQDANRKAAWWSTAQQTAASLRHHFSVDKLGVIGDLVMPQPLNYWSDITLVYWEEFEDSWRAYDVLRDIDPDMRVDLLRADELWLTADQRWQIEYCLVEV